LLCTVSNYIGANEIRDIAEEASFTAKAEDPISSNGGRAELPEISRYARKKN
jgi:hypothetical protein